MILLVFSYCVGWYGYVLVASRYDQNQVDWYEPSKVQWLGLIVTVVIATLAVMTYWFSVQGSKSNLQLQDKD